MAVILDGKMLSAKFRENLKKETAELKSKTGKMPGIAVILAGDDPASSVYVNSKEKAAVEAGFYSVVERISADVTTEDVLALVNKYNSDDKIHGILVQLPLPKGCDEKTILRAIKAEKDVDGFHPYNVGLLNIGEDCLMPCTPYGVMNMMADYGIELAGKNAVVIGRSNIVGKPMALLMLRENATVTITHSHTKNLKEICQNADILIVAVGKKEFITGDYIKQGAVVIDVGIHRDENNKLFGDVKYEEASQKASLITPVPGGVGPMTIAMLMYNCVRSIELQ